MYNILVAEDDIHISELIKLYLSGEKYNVIIANDGFEALNIFKDTQIHLLLTDIMMPKIDGYNLIQEIRKNSNIPILVLSAKDEDNDKILGLNIGADDYITKPFNPIEMVARVNASIRRYYKFNVRELEQCPIIVHDLLTLNTENFKLYKEDKEIILTATEYKILLYMLKSCGRIYSKGQISTYINGDYYESDDNTITVHISHIREKIGLNSKGNPYIKTVKGLGYKIEKE